jgi:hypothetical protein
VLSQRAIGQLDVARIEPDEQRRKVLDASADGASLPFQLRLAPAMEARLVGVDTHEYSVAESALAIWVETLVIFTSSKVRWKENDRDQPGKPAAIIGGDGYSGQVKL